MKLKFIIFIILLFFPAIGHPIDICAKLLVQAVDDGIEVEDFHVSTAPMGTRYFLLGQGAFGSVYRAIFPDHTEAIYKDYERGLRTQKRASDSSKPDGLMLSNGLIISGVGDGGFLKAVAGYDLLDSEDALIQDLITLRFLKKFKAYLFDDTLKVVTAKRILTGKILKLDSIHGRSVHDILDDPSFPLDQRNRLLFRYKRIVEDFIPRLKGIEGVKIERIWEPEHLRGKFSTDDPVQVEFGYNGQKYIVMIKPDNLIFDTNTGQIFLIDPY